MLKDYLNIIFQTAKENNFAEPYIVGGVCRDALLGRNKKIHDIDITCGNKDSLDLGKEVVTKIEGAILNTFSDGHSKLVTTEYKFDFSSNFTIPDIDNILAAMNVKKINDMTKEVYCRDFTVNSLLMPFDFSQVIDLTGLGIKHVEEKVLDTCLIPRLTLGYDPKRIIRLIYLCAKLGFKPSDRVASYIKSHPDLVSTVRRQFVSEKINKALLVNEKYTKQLINYLNLNNYINV